MLLFKQMDKFIENHIPLVNKNSPIVITYGTSISDSIFNSRLTKSTIMRIIENIQKDKDTKHSVNYISNCTDYKYNNQVITKYNNELEYYIIHNKDTYTNDTIMVQILEIHKDAFICPSIPKTHSVCNYDIMKINMYSGCDIIIYDYKTYFKLEIKINKPLPCTVLNQIINYVKS